MKSLFWPRSFRDFLALHIARLAGAIAESKFLCDARYRIALDAKWKQPTLGGALKKAAEGPKFDAVMAAHHERDYHDAK